MRILRATNLTEGMPTRLSRTRAVIRESQTQPRLYLNILLVTSHFSFSLTLLSSCSFVIRGGHALLHSRANRGVEYPVSDLRDTAPLSISQNPSGIMSANRSCDANAVQASHCTDPPNGIFAQDLMPSALITQARRPRERRSGWCTLHNLLRLTVFSIFSLMA